MKWGWRVLTAGIILMLMMFSGCGHKDSMSRAEAEFSDAYQSGDTWLIYWYVCGTDLESENGAATEDLKELMQVKLPPNVRVLIQTGGAESWQTQGISAQAIGRYLYDSEGMHTLEQLPDADMGSRNTLTDFLRYGQSQFTADHRVFVFWDHGGGSAAGVCYDERTEHFLSLNDIRDAFTAVHTPDDGNPPFELIGFDACLMATIDMAADLQGLARYMAASQETEPGNGWNYEGWVGALAQNPAMGGNGLGQVICDSYMAGCREYDTADEATLSVIDLAKVPQLCTAYNAFGAEALHQAAENPQKFFMSFSRDAESSVNYGGNTREQGYTNMADLGDLTRRSKELLPQSADPLLSSLDAAVIYKVSGSYKKNSSGLSCYYAYDGAKSLQKYTQLQAASPEFKSLYTYLLTGTMPADASGMLGGSTAPQQLPATSFSVAALEDTPVRLDADGSAVVQLTPAQMDILSSVHCQCFYYSQADDIILYLGSDSDINADWDTGVFKDNFQGTWPMLDGHPIYIEITDEEDDYNIYSVPIKLNGQECNLQVVYNYNDGEYVILGARRGLNNSGMADRNLIHLKAGDRITTLHYVMTMSGDDEDLTQVEIDTFTIGDHPTVKDEELGDGKYGYFFEFVNPRQETALSEMTTFTVQNGQIYTTAGMDEEDITTANDAGGSLPSGGDSPVPSGGGSIAEQLLR